MICNISIYMAKVEETYSMIPNDADIDYQPLGGKVDTVVSIAKAEIEELASLRAVTAIEDGYGEAGDGAVLDHARRRNLGLI